MPKPSPRLALVGGALLALVALPIAASAGTPPRRDLSRDEARGGHALSRHVGLTDLQLRERLSDQSRLAVASAYTDRETAEEVVALALARAADRIRTWANRQGRRPNLVVGYHGQPGRVIGRSLRRRGRSPRLCYDAVVVLKWDERHGDYFVITSYPEVVP